MDWGGGLMRVRSNKGYKANVYKCFGLFALCFLRNWIQRMKDAERGEPIRGVEAANTTSLSIEAINGVPKPGESDWSGTLRWISC